MPIEHHLSPRSDLFKPPSTLAHTQASTLVLTAGEIIEEELVTDTLSQTSYATSMDEGGGSAKLHVIPVEDVAKGLAHFECIYCWQIQKAQGQKAWKLVACISTLSTGLIRLQKTCFERPQIICLHVSGMQAEAILGPTHLVFS